MMGISWDYNGICKHVYIYIIIIIINNNNNNNYIYLYIYIIIYIYIYSIHWPKIHVSRIKLRYLKQQYIIFKAWCWGCVCKWGGLPRLIAIFIGIMIQSTAGFSLIYHDGTINMAIAILHNYPYISRFTLIYSIIQVFNSPQALPQIYTDD